MDNNKQKKHPTKQQLKRSFTKLTILAVIFLFTCAGTLLYLTNTALDAPARILNLEDISIEIKSELTLYHLWLEEMVMGDDTIADEDILAPLERTQGLIKQMLVGKEEHDEIGVIPQHNEITGALKKLQNDISSLQALGDIRMKIIKGAEAGSDYDAAFDHQFALTHRQADRIKVALANHLEQEIKTYELLVYQLTTGLVFFSLLILFFFTRSYRQQYLDSQQLIVNEAQSRVLLGASVGALVTFNEKGLIESFNTAAEEMLGYSEADVKGLPYSSLIAEPYVEKAIGDFQNHLRTGDMVMFGVYPQIVAKRKNGSTVPVESMLNTVEVDGQRLFVVVSHDISERLRNEAQTRDQEATAKAIVDTVVDAIVTIDENDIVETYNQAAETTFGFTANEVIGNKVTMLMPSSRATQHEGLLAAFRNAGTDAITGSSRPGTGQDKNGRIFPIELSVTEVQLNDRNIMACILRDISDRVKVGQEILDRETRIKAILDNAVDGIITINNQGLIETCNFSTEKIFGFTADEMIGTNFKMLLPEPYAALYSGYLANYQLTGESGVLGANIEISGRRKDDSTFPMELSVTEAKLADRSVYIGIVRDISEQKLTQSNLLQAKEEAERANHAKSEFLSRMSHELRTPLNAILGFGQILDIKKLSPEGDDSVQHILQAGWHLTKLIDEVMDIAHIESGRQNISLEALHVHELLKSSANLMAPLAVVRQIEIITPMPTECNKYVIADRQRLKQVLLNIIANAVKYNHDSGTVELYCNEIPEGILRISVRDTGPGIAPQDFDKAFEPFERLSAENGPIEGSGVGLAVSKTLVKAMGGTLGLDSQLGEGSTFWIEFPLIDYTTELAQPEEHKIEDHGAEQIAPATVLYIEDNTANFHLVEVALSLRPQIKLIEAVQGEIGIELARHHQPDLILLDLHLPVLMGDEVLARLKLYPETQQIPVIIVSANATKGQIERLLASGAYAYLTKPLNIKELLHTIDTVLADSDRKGGGSETP